jgi:hypothetical protein
MTFNDGYASSFSPPSHPNSFMGKKPQISATLPAHVHDEIARRASLLGDSKSNYLSAIASWWFGQGCPKVRSDEQNLGKPGRSTKDEAQLASALSKRLKPVPKNLNVWNLNSADSYVLHDDSVIQGLLEQLGVPNLFAQAAEHDKVQMIVVFDNHPTHWLVLSFYKGVPREGGNGLLFQAEPKESFSREEMLAQLKARAAKAGSEREVKFSQIPGVPITVTAAHPATHASS